MSEPLLTTVEIEPTGPARASVIWLHGLGADAHDFEPIAPELRLSAELGVRFVFPNAPIRPVTVNGGMSMRAWYDVFSMDLPRRDDPDGVQQSAQAIEALLARERQRGIPAARTILAGFSQGGVMALYTGLRYPTSLAGILALSCYLALPDRLEREVHPANRATPIFMAHGEYDAVIPLRYGQQGAETLQRLGYSVAWQSYDLGHEVSWEEIRDIADWLTQVLSAPPS